MESIPEDILFVILVWLPVRSLLRFKSVCKSWYSFIKSSHFTAQHLLVRGRKRSHENLIVFSHSCYFSAPDIALFSASDQFQTSQSLDGFPIPCDPNTLRFRFTSCDGIVCVLDSRSGHVHLWNPATKQSRRLPKSNIQQRADDLTHSLVHFDVGFGFDSNSNSYKVIKVGIESFFNPNEHYREQAEVYTLKADDSWTVIHNINNGSLGFFLSSGSKVACYDNSRYFWLGRLVIRSFDFRNNEFGNMAFPPNSGLIDGVFHPVELASLRGKLACIVTRVLNFTLRIKKYVIWGLNKYGIEVSWTKLYDLPFIPSLRLIDGGILNGADLLLVVKDKQLCLLDCVTQDIIPLQRQISEYFLSETVLYKESLISIVQGPK